jgi:hypothetical protein
MSLTLIAVAIAAVLALVALAMILRTPRESEPVRGESEPAADTQGAELSPRS